LRYEQSVPVRAYSISHFKVEEVKTAFAVKSLHFQMKNGITWHFLLMCSWPMAASNAHPIAGCTAAA